MCPTCTHTMQRLGEVESGRVFFWCSRCGTLMGTTLEHNDIEAPKLVGRCRKMIGGAYRTPLETGETFKDWFHRLGIAEAVSDRSGR